MSGTVSFDDLVSSLRQENPGRVTVISYAGMKFALAAGIDVWDYAETYSLQGVIRDYGTSAQQQRLKEELIASRWASELWLEDHRDWKEAT